MNRSQIEAMKASIKTEYQAKISKLENEMQTALFSLSKVEETLCASNLIQTELAMGNIMRDNIVESAHKEHNQMVRTRIPSIRSRIINALDKIQEGATTNQLLETVNNDGTGKEISKNSFFPEFSRLKKEGIIVVDLKQEGPRPGTYKKAESTPAL